MANIRLVWNQTLGRADWTIVGGRLAAGSDLESMVLLLLFTDRRAAPDYVPDDGSNDLRGWWGDSFKPGSDSLRPIGSRLWQLERRKITNRGALAAEADVMVIEALQPMVSNGYARSILSASEVPAASPGSSGNLLVIRPTIVLPTGKQSAFRYAYMLAGS